MTVTLNEQWIGISTLPPNRGTPSLRTWAPNQFSPRVRKRILWMHVDHPTEVSRPSAMAVNKPGLGSSVDDENEKGIDGGLERTGTLLDLGEEKSPLERGKQSRGEVVRVDVRLELAVGMK